MIYAKLTTEEIKELQSKVHKSVRYRLGLPDNHYNTWLERDVTELGLDITPIETLHHCQKIGPFLQIIRGPNTTTKKMLYAEIERENQSPDKIDLPDPQSPWNQKKNLLKKYDGSMHLLKQYMGTNRLGEETLKTIGNLLPENANGEEVINIIYERRDLIHFKLIHEKEINRRLSELTEQEIDIPERIREILQKQADTHYEQNTHMKGSNNESYKAINNLNKLKPEDITLENTKIDHEGKTQKDDNTIYAKLVASDGSAKDGKAAFGIFAKTRITEGGYNPNFYGGRVNGVQDNYRAELSGVQTIVQGVKERLLPHNHYELEARDNQQNIDYEMPETDLIIASDSESSIKVFNSYKAKILAERLRTANRDIIIDIINHRERIQKDLNTRVHLLWVPAHTQDSNAKKRENGKHQALRRRNTGQNNQR